MLRDYVSVKYMHMYIRLLPCQKSYVHYDAHLMSSHVSVAYIKTVIIRDPYASVLRPFYCKLTACSHGRSGI